jgi:tetratricopeptide (TPR) repeat protein
MAARILLVLALLTTPAAADPATRAARHYDRGQQLYAAGRPRDASSEFQRAFELDAQPKYLYNAAQSLRLAGDCAGAIPLYEAFLRIAPDEDSRKAATHNLERCRPPAEPVERVAEPEPAPIEPAAATPVEPEPAPTVAPPPPAPVVIAAPAAPRPPGKRRAWIGGIGGATAGVALVTAAILEGVAAATFNDLSRSCAPSCTTVQVLPLQRQLDAATGLFVTSGLVAAATIVAILVTRAHTHR